MTTAETTETRPSGDARPDSRGRAMGVLASAERAFLEDAWNRLDRKPAWAWLRKPESGLVMVRGRTGGGGAPFNLGEVTVTRCAVSLETGEAGFAWIMGRDAEKARLAALFDALWQREESRAAIEETVIAPALKARESEDRRVAERTAATRVDFFTLVRGEDEE